MTVYSQVLQGAALDALYTGQVPLAPYRSAEFYDAERTNLFGRAWLLMGRVEEIAKSGDFVVKPVDILSASVLIVRGKDDVIRAFHNVCPHRANQVVWEDKGNQPAFVCRYHNWTFATDGALRGVPDQANFQNLDKSSCHLRAINLQIWEGWIFLNFSDKPDITLEEFLGDMAAHLSGIDYIHAADPVVIQTTLKCNWKVVGDAFAEAYHIPAIHDVSLKPRFADNGNPFGRPLMVQTFGPHGVNSMYGKPDYAPKAHQAIEALAFDPRHRSSDKSEAIARFVSHPAINPTKSASWSMDVNYIFPNTHIDTNALGILTHQFWPISQNETRHEARFYTGRPLGIRERFAMEHRIAHALDIILEDLSNVERTQKGINSGATDVMQLSQSEVVIQHSVAHIMRWVEASSARDALGLSGGASL
ncbi:aromatic ring-hydroxylating dioxygenase subunit alpha [Sphingobium sp. CR2-8]|uniref:aromatic ring-hydroxylating oxygenase subunit alpha n=1 Tax=Sphingobium sp. CR2-8 TaxID=1306534 RepID=UPI002DB9B2A5|nr:aromatic ring-hydroxylating dioxygenase subunit alpha [Sphingobium sp. CR2-8]MEC3911892.1 aromatic ring-hydroxylating dioxygenase subunit alpha [Sphingobium sp. CR2-8]